MSPLQIEMLLHYYYSPAPHPREATISTDHFAVSLYAEFVDHLGVLERIGHTVDSPAYRLTERGKVYVERLVATPLPRKVVTETWVFDEIDEP